jgi:hypothetical protein
LVEDHEAQDQFLRVAVKRLTETQLFEDELKEVSQLNTVLLAHNQELEAQLAEESQAKTSKCLSDFLFWNKTMFEQSPELIISAFYSIHGAAHGPWRSSR